MTTRCGSRSAADHRGPTHEPVDRVPTRGLVEQELMLPPVELVAAVLHPVRPGAQDLPAPGGADLVGAVAVEHVAARHQIRAEPAANLDDDRTLIAQRDLELLSRRSDRRHRPSSAAVGCPAYGPAPVRFAAPQRAASSRAASTSMPEPSAKVSPAANESPAP